MALAFQVKAVFSIYKQGTVLSGSLSSGTLSLGQKVLIVSPSEHIEARIKSLESKKASVSLVSAPQEVGILFNSLDLALLASGIKEQEEGRYKVIDLFIRETPKPWWQFWA